MDRERRAVFVGSPRSSVLPLDRSSGPWPLGRFSAGLRRVRGSSLKAAVRTVFSSRAMCMALRPRKLPMKQPVGRACPPRAESDVFHAR